MISSSKTVLALMVAMCIAITIAFPSEKVEGKSSSHESHIDSTERIPDYWRKTEKKTEAASSKESDEEATRTKRNGESLSEEESESSSPTTTVKSYIARFFGRPRTLRSAKEAHVANDMTEKTPVKSEENVKDQAAEDKTKAETTEEEIKHHSDDHKSEEVAPKFHDEKKKYPL